MMKLYRILKITPLLFFFIIAVNGIAQDSNNSDNDFAQNKKKGFRLGLYIGSYFANQYTAGMYDGYGFDIDGNKNNWENSLMNQKINVQYGHGNQGFGQVDQIGQALNVDPAGQPWVFDASDMPQNMRYTPAFLVGLNTIYSVDKNNAILLNLDASKLTITGNFTIITPPTATSTQINDRIKTFAITGGEQRLLFQFGYQRILGDNEKLNFFVEGGLMATIAEFSKNEILINTLRIDLTQYYNSYMNPNGLIFKKPIGTGFGVFGGFGANITIGTKYTIQILYNPTYEKINIGANPTLKFQHAIGLRAYYNF